MQSLKLRTAIASIALLLGGCTGLDIISVQHSKFGDLSQPLGAERRVTSSDRWLWRGVMVTAAVPIPLMIPMGSENTVEWFLDGKVIGGESEKTHATGVFACIYLVLCYANEGMWGQVIFNGAKLH